MYSRATGLPSAPRGLGSRAASTFKTDSARGRLKPSFARVVRTESSISSSSCALRIFSAPTVKMCRRFKPRLDSPETHQQTASDLRAAQSSSTNSAAMFEVSRASEPATPQHNSQVNTMNRFETSQPMPYLIELVLASSNCRNRQELDQIISTMRRIQSMERLYARS
jgi:hypothetical protein